MMIVVSILLLNSWFQEPKKKNPVTSLKFSKVFFLFFLLKAVFIWHIKGLTIFPLIQKIQMKSTNPLKTSQLSSSMNKLKISSALIRWLAFLCFCPWSSQPSVILSSSLSVWTWVSIWGKNPHWDWAKPGEPRKHSVTWIGIWIL